MKNTATGWGTFVKFEKRQTKKQKTCKRQEKTDEMTSASRRNKFDVLNLTDHGVEVRR